jgi:hypothetical protein
VSNIARKSCWAEHKDQGIYEDNEEEVSLPQPLTQSSGTMNGTYN